MATLTVDYAGVTQLGCSIVMSEWSSVDTADPTVQSASDSGTNTATAFVLTLVANPVIAVVCHLAAEGTTPGTGWTEINDVNAAGPNLGAESEYDTSNSGLVGASWATSANYVALAAEIRGTGGGATFVQSLGALYDTTDATSYNHTVTAPSAGNVVFVGVFNPRANSTVTVPTVSGMSLTWTQEATVLINPGSGTRLRGTLFFGVPVSGGGGPLFDPPLARGPLNLGRLSVT